MPLSPFLRIERNVELELLREHRARVSDKAHTGLLERAGPAEGFLATRAEVLQGIQLTNIPRRFFFETARLLNSVDCHGAGFSTEDSRSVHMVPEFSASSGWRNDPQTSGHASLSVTETQSRPISDELI